MNEEKKPLTNEENPKENVVYNEENVNQNANNLENVVPQNANTSSQIPQKKGGNFKYVLTVILFIFLFAFVFFLPDISNEIKTYQKKQQQQPFTSEKQEVNSGTMSCTLNQETGKRNITATVEFTFENKKLKSTNTITKTDLENTATGEDLKALENSAASCEHLETLLEDVSGFSVHCNQTSLSLTKSETVDYETFSLDSIQSNIAEFEGNVPEFQLDQNIDDIESVMASSGYDCAVK